MGEAHGRGFRDERREVTSHAIAKRTEASNNDGSWWKL